MLGHLQSYKIKICPDWHYQMTRDHVTSTFFLKYFHHKYFYIKKKMSVISTFVLTFVVSTSSFFCHRHLHHTYIFINLSTSLTSRGERSQHGHGSYWTKTISATCYGENFFFLNFCIYWNV